MLLVQELDCDWQAEQFVILEDGWIDVIKAKDENSQYARIVVWGPNFNTAGCAQLDSDPESQAWVISRGEGTGPY